MTKKTKRNEQGIILRSIAIGYITSILTALCWMILFAWLMVIKDIPEFSTKLFIYFILIISSFVGGFTAVRCYGKSCLKIGTAVGFTVFSTLFLCGIILNGLPQNYNFFIKVLTTIFFGILGGTLGVNVTNKRKMKI